MDESIVMSDPQTLLCAHWEPPYCDVPAVSQDLCKRHYRNHWKKKDAPPTFVTRRIGHNIENYDPATGTGSCFICGPNAPAYRTTRGYLTCAYYNVGNQRLRKTGWDAERYDLALIAQAGRCGLCGNPPEGRGKYDVLVADHCHVSGDRRKLLCGWCNAALGLMQDNAEVLRLAAEYVTA